MVNIFENPNKYLGLINNIKLVNITKEKYFPELIVDYVKELIKEK